MEHAIVVMALLVIVALIFDFMNGFHDAANSIALMVSTRLLTPQAAVLWAAFFNFIAFLIFGTAVAKMVGKGLIDLQLGGRFGEPHLVVVGNGDELDVGQVGEDLIKCMPVVASPSSTNDGSPIGLHGDIPSTGVITVSDQRQL